MARLIEITYSRSAIGRNQRQRRTLQALGLRKLQDTVRHTDTSAIRGMVARISHLLTTREVEEGTET